MWMRIESGSVILLCRRCKPKKVAPFPEARAFCLKTMLDQHSLSKNASRIVQKHELGRSEDVQAEFQPASNLTNMKHMIKIHFPPLYLKCRKKY
jgi:hypothetical protein